MAMTGKERMDMMKKWRNFRLNPDGDPELIKEAKSKNIIQTEAEIFDSIVEFKKAINESDHRKNKKIQSIIKELMKLEDELGELTSKL
tara:strand:+ start:26 stop:289 length:264 start_codon:yes stop_codon:yes gene_type:complete